MNYFPFHIGDYAIATRHLSWEEDCAFRRLLDVYYTTEKPLPTELRAVCRLVLATTEQQREAVSVVLAEFFIATDAGWINSRADKEIEAMRAKQQMQRDKANKRWDKPKLAVGIAVASIPDATALIPDATAMPPTPTPTPTPIPIPIEEKEISPAARVSTSKGCRLDADWVLPKAWGEWAQGEYPHWDGNTVRLIALGFRNHWVAKTGKDATKLDWYGTWQNWCISDITQRGNGPPGAAAETVYQRSMRERMEQISPSIAARRPGAPPRTNPMEVIDGLTRIAG